MALCVWGCLGLVVLQRLGNFCLLQSNILLKTQRWYCIVCYRALDAWECWWWELGGGLFPESPALSLRPSSIHPHSGTHPRSHNHEKHRAKNTGCNLILLGGENTVLSCSLVLKLLRSSSLCFQVFCPATLNRVKILTEVYLTDSALFPPTFQKRTCPKKHCPGKSCPTERRI